MNGSQRAYARHRQALGLSGGTLRAVQKAIEGCRITLGLDGKIDFESADEAWSRNTDPSVPTSTDGFHADDPDPGTCPRPGTDQRTNRLPDQRTPSAPVSGPPSRRHAAVDEESDANDFRSARTRRELAEAKRAENKLAEEERRLLPREEVTRMLSQAGKIYASVRQALPVQLATKLVGKTDLTEIERIIRASLIESDTRISNELESRFPDLGPNDGDSLNSSSANL